jgi:2-phosphosulfolactate phosphatase
MHESVIIDCFPSSVARYRQEYAIVAIDVIRATTMAISSAASGRRTFCANSLEAVRRIAERLEDPLVAGELGGDVPAGFEMNNSPAELLERTDLHRPLILLSSSGTKLVWEASQGAEPAYLACFRNYSAVSEYLAGRHRKIAVIGAGSREEFREEDQICCAWIAERLIQAGYAAENRATLDIVERWSGAPPAACWGSNSVGYLRRSGQLRDLTFILEHVDDLDCAFTITRDEIVMPTGALTEMMEAA